MKFRFGPLAHGWISTAFSLSKLVRLMRTAHAHLPAAAHVHLDGVTAGVFSHVSFPKSASVLYQEPSLTVLASLTHLNLTTCTNTYCIDSHINNYLYFAYFAQQHAEETSYNGYISDKQ